MLAFLPELLAGFSHNISIFKEMRSIQHTPLCLGLLSTQLKQILSSASNASFHRFKRCILEFCTVVHPIYVVVRSCSAVYLLSILTIKIEYQWNPSTVSIVLLCSACWQGENGPNLQQASLNGVVNKLLFIKPYKLSHALGAKSGTWNQPA